MHEPVEGNTAVHFGTAAAGQPGRLTGTLCQRRSQVLYARAQLHDDLVADEGAVLVGRRPLEIGDKRGEGQRRIDHDRPHVADLLQVRVDVDRIEDAEILLADLVAAARRAADHLVVEDAAVDPADEDQVGDRRHVDAGGEQIDGHDIFRARVVLERLDPVERLVDRCR